VSHRRSSTATDAAQRAERRRRRHAPDWGGDALFAAPRSRERQSSRERAAAPQSVPDELIRDAAHDAHPPDAMRDPATDGTARALADEPFAHARTRESARDEVDRELAALHAASPRTDARRMVRVTGRPGEVASTRPARRRPARPAHERLGPRPDRVAAWAVALGLLLVLIAVLSSV